MKLTNHVYLVGSGEFGLSHEFDCNVYLLDTADGFVMVDTGAGCNVASLITNIRRDGIDLERKGLKKVLLTHGHADHAGGACELKQRYDCAIYIGEQEAEIVEKGDEEALGLDVAKKSGFYSSNYIFKKFRVSACLKHNDNIRIGELEIHALSVPGHSPGSICYLVQLPEGKALFTGDVVFPNGVIGLLNYKGSSLSDYRRYIQRLEGLGVDILLPGHRGFVLREGQKHIDLAIQALKLLQVPQALLS